MTGIQQWEQIAALGAELRELKESIATSKQGSLEPSSQSRPRIPPSLSVSVTFTLSLVIFITHFILGQVSVKALHDKAPNDIQFDGSEM